MQEEPQQSVEPQAAASATRKRRRRDTPVESLLQIMRDSEAARERLHGERMALLRELIDAVRANKE